MKDLSALKHRKCRASEMPVFSKDTDHFRTGCQLLLHRKVNFVPGLAPESELFNKSVAPESEL